MQQLKLDADGRSFVDAINQRTMASANAVRLYGSLDSLTSPERVIFEQLRSEVEGRPILDLGVGAGRTVRALLEMSSDYVGIDYTPAMVEASRTRFPHVRFELADARDLSRFSDGHFKLAVFSCNGLCMVEHAGRLQILREVSRVLADDGVFVFSTYNQSSTDHVDGLVLPKFVWSRNPLRLVWRALHFARDSALHAYNYHRFSSKEYRGTDYSIVNDRCHNYATMLYYIDMRRQRRQLARVGFRADAEAYGMDGERVSDDSTDSSITFVARKDAVHVAQVITMSTWRERRSGSQPTT